MMNGKQLSRLSLYDKFKFQVSSIVLTTLFTYLIINTTKLTLTLHHCPRSGSTEPQEDAKGGDAAGACSGGGCCCLVIFVDDNTGPIRLRRV